MPPERALPPRAGIRRLQSGTGELDHADFLLFFPFFLSFVNFFENETKTTRAEVWRFCLTFLLLQRAGTY